MDKAEKKAREEAAEMRTQRKTDDAYRKSLTSTEERPKDGVNKGEMGKKWEETFKK